jgi:hypothetical protein
MTTLLLAQAAITFDPRHHRIGPAPDEVLLHYVVASSTFSGPRIALSAATGAGDEWATMRGDGVMTCSSNHVLCTTDGQLVCVRLDGLYDVGEDGYVDALDDLLASKVRAEVAVRFYTAAPEYRWLNRTVLAASGERDFAAHALNLRVYTLETSS